MLTMFDDDSVRAALRAGARGYVLKGAGQHDIVRAIHAVAAGEAILSPGVTRVLPTAAIGARPGMATKTVTNHASALCAELGVADRAGAVARARRAGMGRSQ
jgi:DNA-binding NarL/FixJ family response regulator